MGEYAGHSRLTPEEQLAQDLFQLAYDIDIGSSNVPPEITEQAALDGVSTDTLKMIFEGLMGLQKLRDHLQQFPDGAFTELARSLRSRLVARGEIGGSGDWYGVSSNT